MFDYAPPVGFSNPDVPWSALEGALSGRELPDGGDGSAFSRKRDPYIPAGAVDPPGLGPVGERVAFAELHCHSNFSFLDGASHPEELVEQAARLGLDAIALTDHNGMYGVVRLAEAARELGVATVFGSELSLGLSAPQNGAADPEGSHLLLLAREIAVCTVDGHCTFLDAHSGTVRGHVNLEAKVVTSPAVSHGVLVVGTCSGRVTGIDIGRRSPVWQTTDAPRDHTSFTLLPDGSFVTTAARGNVVARRSTDGAFLWETSQQLGLPEHHQEIDTTPVVGADGSMYCGSYSGYLYHFLFRPERS